MTTGVGAITPPVRGVAFIGDAAVRSVPFPSLLTLGNQKVGEAVHLWSLPARGVHCPGASSLCERVCYAAAGRYRLPAVRRRLRWNRAQARRPDFAARMIDEVRRKGCVVVRVHASGDFFSAEYAEAWWRVMAAVPQPRYYWYTRSWRVPEIRGVLERMAALSCCRGWFSTDDETGLPDDMPVTVRVAHLMTRSDEPLPDADLVFRPRGLRRVPLPIAVACPSESPDGTRRITCGTCKRCWQ